jgi:hypothetical protein
MVKFIEIKDGIFVKADSIEAVIDTPDKGESLCMVYTVTNSFPSILPSSVILEMISSDKKAVKEPDKTAELLEQMLNIMKTQNTPMGG